MEHFEADEENGRPRTELEMPPVDAALHLIEHLFVVGPAQSGEALTFREISAWMSTSGHQLNGWEVETLRRLSQAYLGEYFAAKDPRRLPPFRSATVLKREEVAAKILAVFAAFEGQDAKTGK